MSNVNKNIPECHGWAWTMVEHRPQGDVHFVCFNNTGNEFNPHVHLGIGGTEEASLRLAIENLDKVRDVLEGMLNNCEVDS